MLIEWTKLYFDLTHAPEKKNFFFIVTVLYKQSGPEMNTIEKCIEGGSDVSVDLPQCHQQLTKFEFH